MAACVCICSSRLENFQCFYASEIMSGFILCSEIMLYVYCFMALCIVCQVALWSGSVFIKFLRITLQNARRANLGVKKVRGITHL